MVCACFLLDCSSSLTFNRSNSMKVIHALRRYGLPLQFVSVLVGLTLCQQPAVAQSFTGIDLYTMQPGTFSTGHAWPATFGVSGVAPDYPEAAAGEKVVGVGNAAPSGFTGPNHGVLWTGSA